ncbi:MAG: hypothetical protein ACOYXA_18820 [Bacteroidota bacterium]
MSPVKYYHIYFHTNDSKKNYFNKDNPCYFHRPLVPTDKNLSVSPRQRLVIDWFGSPAVYRISSEAQSEPISERLAML